MFGDETVALTEAPSEFNPPKPAPANPSVTYFVTTGQSTGTLIV